ncbi:MAG: hypothetical protein ABIV50_02840, partial [Opitutus sp.]
LSSVSRRKPHDFLMYECLGYGLRIESVGSSHRRETMEVRWGAPVIGLTTDATRILRSPRHG